MNSHQIVEYTDDLFSTIRSDVWDDFMTDDDDNWCRACKHRMTLDIEQYSECEVVDNSDCPGAQAIVNAMDVNILSKAGG